MALGPKSSETNIPLIPEKRLKKQTNKKTSHIQFKQGEKN